MFHVKQSSPRLGSCAMTARVDLRECVDDGRDDPRAMAPALLHQPAGEGAHAPAPSFPGPMLPGVEGEFARKFCVSRQGTQSLQIQSPASSCVFLSRVVPAVHQFAVSCFSE